MDEVVELAKEKQEDFEASWPGTLYKFLTRVVVPMTANRKLVEVGDKQTTDT